MKFRHSLFLFAVKEPSKIPLIVLIIPILILHKIERMKKEISVKIFLHDFCLKYHLLNLVPKIEVFLFEINAVYPYYASSGESKFLSRTEGELFVDVGANLGKFTIPLARKYKRVIAIEPNPLNMYYLRSNVKNAGLTNVTLLQCAVSDKNGHTYLHFGPYLGRHSIVTNYGRGKEKVKTLTLASIIEEDHVDLIKVDVEGAEWLVLKGAEPVLERIKSWVVELHDTRKKELEKWFEDKNYLFKWLDYNHIYAKKTETRA